MVVVLQHQHLLLLVYWYLGRWWPWQFICYELFLEKGSRLTNDTCTKEGKIEEERVEVVRSRQLNASTHVSGVSDSCEGLLILELPPDKHSFLFCGLTHQFNPLQV